MTSAHCYKDSNCALNSHTLRLGCLIIASAFFTSCKLEMTFPKERDIVSETFRNSRKGSVFRADIVEGTPGLSFKTSALCLPMDCGLAVQCQWDWNEHIAENRLLADWKQVAIDSVCTENGLSFHEVECFHT